MDLYTAIMGPPEERWIYEGMVTPWARRCLVTASSGVALVLARQLINFGHEVTVWTVGEIAEKMSKEWGSQTPIPPKLEIVRGEPHDQTLLQRVTAGKDWIFHLAEKCPVDAACSGSESEYFAVNVEWTKRLVDAARCNGAKKFILFSTVEVYGPSDGTKVFDETDPVNPCNAYAASKVAAERVALAAGIGAVLRTGTILGWGSYGYRAEVLKKAIRRMAEMEDRDVEKSWRLLYEDKRDRRPLWMRKEEWGLFFVKDMRRRYNVIGEGKQRWAVIYVEDAARAARIVAEEGPVGEIYNVTDGKEHRFIEIIDLANYVATGEKEKKMYRCVPRRLIERCIKLSERGLLPFELRITCEEISRELEDFAASSDKIRRELGFEASCELKLGLKDIYDEAYSVHLAKVKKRELKWQAAAKVE